MNLVLFPRGGSGADEGLRLLLRPEPPLMRRAGGRAGSSWLSVAGTAGE